jgi:hypothetical protein
MFADVGRVIAMTADGGVLEGRSTVEPPRSSVAPPGSSEPSR